MTAPVPTNPAALGSSEHFVNYAGAVADTDLSAEGKGQACRKIRANTAGTLVVKRASDLTEVTLNFLAGEVKDINATALVASGSTATGIEVRW